MKSESETRSKGMRIRRHHDAYIVVVGAVLSGTVGLGPDIVEVEESRPSAETMEHVGEASMASSIEHHKYERSCLRACTGCA